MVTILVVDDQAMNRKLVATLFGYFGERVLEAEDGVEALERARAEKPDVVITDIVMPRMDGVELVQTLRRDPDLASIPVIFYTATYRERESRSIASACDVSVVVPKPCEPGELLRAVYGVLGMEAPSMRASAPTPPVSTALEPVAIRFSRTLEESRGLQERITRAADTVPPDARRELDEASARCAELLLQLETSGLRLATLVELGLDVARARGAGETVSLLCRGAQNVLSARYAVLGLLADDGESVLMLVMRGYRSPDEAALRASPPSLEALLGGRASRRAEIPDGDPRLVGLSRSHPAIRSSLAVALSTRLRKYGWLFVGDRLGMDAFTSEDEELALALAAQGAAALENAFLYEEVGSRSAKLEVEVAERRRAEREAREAEERYRGLFERAVEGIFRSTPEGRFLDVNPAFVRMLGYSSPEDLIANVEHIGRQLYVDPAVRDEYLRILTEQGWVAGFEDELRRPDGSTVWLKSNTRAVRDANGQLLYLEGMCEDVTERRRAEAALKESERHYRALFDANPFAMWLYDPESLRIVAVNDAAVRQYGWSREELLSMTLKDVRPPAEVEKLVQAIASTPIPDHYVGLWKHRRKDGTELDVEVHVDEVIVAGRTLRLSLNKDVTEHRKLEDQLRQAQKMEAVGRLAGGVAHDFNNLLTVINGYTELLIDSFPADPARRAKILGEIAKAGERAAALTRQLLAFSRKQVVAPRTIDLSKVVSGIESLLRRLIGEDVKLVASFAPRLWPVRADPGQVEQVIMNLAVNARDAMPKGGTLTIETRNVELDETYTREHTGVSPGPYAMLAVSDTGTGMDEETKAHLFEPFFTTKEQGKGTGLGLSTVYGIVHQFGGHVWVYSELGIGTAFKVYLPKLSGRATSRPSLARLPAVERGAETVLLVEDEESIRRLAADVLRGGGYTVLEAPLPSAAIAISESEKGPIHVLVTDIVMPEMSGPDLAEAIRARHPAIRTLFMSGYANDSVFNHHVLEAGAPFLEKPFRPADLTRKVRQVLEAKTG
jgi:PAS domain S-box-containing protein